MFEVTAEEWNACVTDEACPPRGRMSGNDRHPVSGVSWLDITQDYLPWLNRKLGLSGHLAYRLPTDAEWEYAARAGTASRYAAGDLLTTREARFLMHDPAPVGSYPPNGFGLHDMAGNAPEWVQDCIRPPYETAPRDGSAVDVSDCDLRIYRDADWHSLPWYMRAASRHLSDQDNVHRNIGFRLARTLAQ